MGRNDKQKELTPLQKQFAVSPKDQEEINREAIRMIAEERRKRIGEIKYEQHKEKIRKIGMIVCLVLAIIFIPLAIYIHYQDDKSPLIRILGQISTLLGMVGGFGFQGFYVWDPEKT